ncbi:MAG: PhzF family phenazine biosynthesis protein [Pseudomonadota bacterium]
MKLRFHTLDVFTEQRFGGNPLAVVLEADALTPAQMQQIAREFNLSETVFVQKATRKEALVRARIFTPAKELPFAGHPTVGTACLLAQLGFVPDASEIAMVLEEGVGPVSVTVRRATSRPLFAQLTTAKLPEFGPPAPSAAELAAMLGLAAEDIEVTSEKPRMTSCGLPYVLAPLHEAAALSRIAFDVARWKPLLSAAWADHVLAYHRDGEQVRARMFAPGSGVFEDPATGSAAVALAGALASESPLREGTLRWTIEQGVDMGRPSLLYAEAEKKAGEVVAVRVGGYAVNVLSGEIEL